MIIQIKGWILLKATLTDWTTEIIGFPLIKEITVSLLWLGSSMTHLINDEITNTITTGFIGMYRL